MEPSTTTTKTTTTITASIPTNNNHDTTTNDRLNQAISEYFQWSIRKENKGNETLEAFRKEFFSPEQHRRSYDDEATEVDAHPFLLQATAHYVEHCAAASSSHQVSSTTTSTPLPSTPTTSIEDERVIVLQEKLERMERLVNVLRSQKKTSKAAWEQKVEKEAKKAAEVANKKMKELEKEAKKRELQLQKEAKKKEQQTERQAIKKAKEAAKKLTQAALKDVKQKLKLVEKEAKKKEEMALKEAKKRELEVQKEVKKKAEELEKQAKKQARELQAEARKAEKAKLEAEKLANRKAKEAERAAEQKKRKMWPSARAKLFKKQDMESLPESFEGRLELLKKFKLTYGHLRVVATMDRPLSWCCIELRKLYKTQKLTEDQIAQLNEIGFLWDTSTPKIPWEDRFEELQRFKATHGHTVVRRDGKDTTGFSDWCRNQRRRFRSGILDSEKAQQLRDIGFDLSTKQKRNFDDFFRLLVDFKLQHGHLDVPPPLPHTKDSDSAPGVVAGNGRTYYAVEEETEEMKEHSLRCWVVKLRKMYYPKYKKKMKGLLNHDKVNRLESIGFDWKYVEG